MALALHTPVVDETDLFPICRSMVRVSKLLKTRDLIRASLSNGWPIIGLSAVLAQEILRNGLTTSIGASGRSATLRILFESRPLFGVHQARRINPS